MAPGAPFLVLPPGIHWATLNEIETRFIATARRRWLFKGLVNAVDELRNAGCRRLFLDGSFVTAKEKPNDYDGCWDPSGVVAAKFDPVLLDFSDGRLSIAEIGLKLIEARIVQGLSQRELADRLGMKEQQVQRYEQDQYFSANLTRCAEVAAVLDMDLHAQFEVRQLRAFR